MSRLWPERLLVSIEPGAVTWSSLRNGVRGHAAKEGRLDADPSCGPEVWRGAMQSLRAEAQGWLKQRLRVSVVLSNHFVRYAKLPPPPRDATPEEEIALARFHLEKIHGERARDWAITVTDDVAGPRLACAVDEVLIAELKACFPAQDKARLVSVQPRLILAFNRVRRRIPRAGAWLLLLEPDRACLGLYAAGGWHAVHNGRGAGTGPEGWAALLGRERNRADTVHAPSTVLVSAPWESVHEDVTVGPWTFRRIGHPDARQATGSVVR